MFDTHDLGTFVAAGVLLNLSPGPDTLYIIARTVSQGHMAGVMSVLGISSGCVVHMLLAAFGLSAILAVSATAFTVVKYVGAVYLIYLGIQALWQNPKLVNEAVAGQSSTNLAIYRQGFLTNLLNPKVAIFFLAFLPQFVVTDSTLGPLPFLFLGLIFLLTGTLWCFVIVILASYATRTIRSNQRVVGLLEKLRGLVFIALGLNLLRARPQTG
jgi:threonine/homoserine/homoserine lactone efflux protein